MVLGSGCKSGITCTSETCIGGNSSCDSFITGHLAGKLGFFTGGKSQSESMIMGSSGVCNFGSVGSVLGTFRSGRVSSSSANIIL